MYTKTKIIKSDGIAEFQESCPCPPPCHHPRFPFAPLRRGRVPGTGWHSLRGTLIAKELVAKVAGRPLRYALTATGTALAGPCALWERSLPFVCIVCIVYIVSFCPIFFVIFPSKSVRRSRNTSLLTTPPKKAQEISSQYKHSFSILQSYLQKNQISPKFKDLVLFPFDRRRSGSGLHPSRRRLPSDTRTLPGAPATTTVVVVVVVLPRDFIMGHQMSRASVFPPFFPWLSAGVPGPAVPPPTAAASPRVAAPVVSGHPSHSGPIPDTSATKACFSIRLKKNTTKASAVSFVFSSQISHCPGSEAKIELSFHIPNE